ncbi:MAG: hypothetical protein GC150_04770 [Rhizobiales bacterium]|nr:hypothetical protein [Hyphomicrobiales bacterium]
MVGFARLWRDRYGDVPPLGHDLRQERAGSWARAYGLPGGKRYATTAGEQAEIAARAEAIAAFVLGGADAEAWVVGSFVDGSGRKYKKRVKRSIGLPAGVRPTMNWREADGDSGGEGEPGARWLAYARSLRWQPGCWADLLADIADDRIANVVFVSPDAGRVFAPYDGGFDVILEGEGEVERLRALFTPWLSPRVDGL